MQVARRAQVDGFDVGVGEELFSFVVAGRLAEVHRLAAALEVAAGAAQVARELLLVMARYSRELESGNLRPGVEVRRAHES